MLYRIISSIRRKKPFIHRKERNKAIEIYIFVSANKVKCLKSKSRRIKNPTSKAKPKTKIRKKTKSIPKKTVQHPNKKLKDPDPKKDHPQEYQNLLNLKASELEAFLFWLISYRFDCERQCQVDFPGCINALSFNPFHSSKKGIHSPKRKE